MIWSTPLATSCVLRSSDIELIVLSLFLPPTIYQFRGDVIHSTLLAWFYFPFSTGGCPHFQWKTSWFVVLSRRCRVSSLLYMSPHYNAHLLRPPPLSVISLLSLLSMTAALCYLVLMRSLVCRRMLCCFLLSLLSSWHHIAPLSNFLWLTSLCNVGTAHCIVI